MTGVLVQVGGVRQWICRSMARSVGYRFIGFIDISVCKKKNDVSVFKISVCKKKTMYRFVLKNRYSACLKNRYIDIYRFLWVMR